MSNYFYKFCHITVVTINSQKKSKGWKFMDNQKNIPKQIKLNKYIRMTKNYLKGFSPVFIMFGLTCIATLIGLVSSSMGEKIDYGKYILVSQVLTAVFVFVSCFVFIRISFPQIEAETKIAKNMLFDKYLVLFFTTTAICMQGLASLFSLQPQKNLQSGANGAEIETIGVIVFFTIFIVPMYEELIFRYFSYTYFYRAVNNKNVANISQSALFAICHLSTNPAEICLYFACGVILGKLYERCGIKTSYMYHCLFNAAALVPITQILGTGLTLKIVLIVYVVYIALIVKKNKKGQKDD